MKYNGLICCFLLMLTLQSYSSAIKHSASIYVSDYISAEENLAAREIRKYIFLRTNELLPIIKVRIGEKISGNAIIVGIAGKGLMNSHSISFPVLESDDFILKTIPSSSGKQLFVCGGSPVGTLYAAYHLAEQLGVGFYLDGDVIPDRKIPFVLPDLDILRKPLFSRRGIQPFHDFPEGPDWWNTQDYMAIFAQLPKLKMNFFGLHTYPEGSVGPEPLTWIGLPEDVNRDGTVKTAYPSHHFVTINDGGFGYKWLETSKYSFGTGQLTIEMILDRIICGTVHPCQSLRMRLICLMILEKC